jgi:anti-sigma factor RsiW
VAYLWGDLDPDASERFERHLLDCDECWAAVVEDGQGRAAAESLRELAPAALRDRIRFAVAGEKGPAGRSGSRRFRRAAAALTVILTAGAVVGGRHLMSDTRRSDQASVAAVVQLARAGTGPEAAPATRLTVGGQTISVTHLHERGTPVVVARSDRPFPRALGATPMLRDDSPWLATRGRLNLVCVNRPHPVLLVARMPADQLIDLAVQLAR